MHQFWNSCHWTYFQSDVRSMSVNHWGSELGLQVLKSISKLYTSLVWESSVLIALCSDSVIPPDSDFGLADVNKVMMHDQKVTASKVDKDTVIESSLSRINEGELETLLARSELGGGSDGVSVAMESLTTSEAACPMETDDLLGAAGLSVPGSAAAAGGKYNKLIQNRIRQIKPLLTASSRLGRALAELFGLLVKLSVGTPVRQRRAQQIAPTATAPTPAAKAIATALTKLLAQGLSWMPPPYCPMPKLRYATLIFIISCRFVYCPTCEKQVFW